MLAVSLFISSLASRMRHQANVAMLREARAGNLYMLGKELAAVLTLEQILEIGRRHLGAVFGAKTAFCLPDSGENVRVAAPEEHDAHALQQEGMEFYGKLSFLKAGMAYSSHSSGPIHCRLVSPLATTVSATGSSRHQ